MNDFCKKVLNKYTDWLNEQSYLCSTMITGPHDDGANNCSPSVDLIFRRDLIDEFIKDVEKDNKSFYEAIMQDGKEGRIDVSVLKMACKGELTDLQLSAVDDVLTDFLEDRMDHHDLPLFPNFEFHYNCYGCQLYLSVDDTIDEYPELIKDFSRFTHSKLMHKTTYIEESFRSGEECKEYKLIFDVGV